jgi:hypothetical protein
MGVARRGELPQPLKKKGKEIKRREKRHVRK